MLDICRGERSSGGSRGRAGKGRARAAGTVLAASAAAGLCLASPAAASAAQPPAGTALNWGAIYSGNADVSVPAPAAVNLPGGTRLTAIAAAGYDSLALTSAGGVLAWGQDTYGQLGNGTTATANTSPPAPVDLPKGTRVTAIAAGGNDGLAVTSSGGVLAWGWNAYGQLGDGTRANSSTPVPVDLPAGTRVTSVAADGVDSLLVTSTGGLLGMGMSTGSLTPVPVDLPAGTRVTSIATSDNYSLAVTSTGRVLAWGQNTYGQLGNGTTTDSSAPVPVDLPAGTRVTSVAVGDGQSLAVTSDGHVLAWGQNDYGELGNGTTTDSSTPVPVDLPPGTRVTAIAAGYRHGLALTSAGGVLAWGINSGGELGEGTTGKPSTTPVWVELPADTHVTAIAAGNFSNLALAWSC